MKKNTYIILSLLISAFLFTACQKDPLPIYNEGEQTYGSATAQRNGSKWEASVGAQLSNNDLDKLYIQIGTFSEDGFQRESISIQYLDLEKGKTKVNSDIPVSERDLRVSYTMLVDDGDAVSDYYYTDDEKDNWVEITCIDLEEMKVEGKFKLNFKIDTPNPNFSNPEEIKFRSGKFKADIL